MTPQPLGKQRTGKFGEKAAFIRSQPDSMSPRDIVAAGALQGLKISVPHVYALRKSTEKSGSRDENALGVSTPKTNGRLSDSNGRPTYIEQRIRAAMAEVGLRRAREIFNTVAMTFLDG